MLGVIIIIVGIIVAIGIGRAVYMAGYYDGLEAAMYEDDISPLVYLAGYTEDPVEEKEQYDE